MTSEPTHILPSQRPAVPVEQGTIVQGQLLVNTYRVDRLLGGGGMGEVFLAHHDGLGTEHAIKVIRPSLARDQQVMDLFYREARVLRDVRHDAVVNYDGFVRDDLGRDYLVMEYVAGLSLATLLERGPLPSAEVWTLRDRLAGGLAIAHQKGAVHRDISPDNVILPDARVERAKLIDFGLCKLTDPSQQTIVGDSFAGKYRFASPEQFGLFEGQLDARSDIYSLGLVLAAAARGEPLDMGVSFEAAIRLRRQTPDLSSLPEQLRPWLSAMLQPDPAERPQSMQELLTRWPDPSNGTLVLDDTHIPGQGQSQTGGARPGARRKPWVPAAIAGSLLLIVGAGLYMFLAQRSGDGSPSGESAPATAGRAPAYQPTYGIPAVGLGQSADTQQASIGSVQLDQAFEQTRDALARGGATSPEETFTLIQALREAGRQDDAFLLARELAKSGHGPAAQVMAQMYDPADWSPETSPFSRPNAQKAADWYARAAAAGVPGAADRGDELLREAAIAADGAPR